MENNKVILSSLALDLKRIALAYHRGSYKVGDRFVKETKRWMNEVDVEHIPPYIKRLLHAMDQSLKKHNKKRVAEDALMYSTLLQNYSIK